MWQIIGAGAIGCLWAANFIQSGQKVHLVSRKKTLDNILFYQDLTGQQFTLPCSCSSELLPENTPILVCVKAAQVKQALLAQRHHIAPSQAIILMHNGMGSAEEIANIFPQNPIICATTANASLVNNPLDIIQTGRGITYLGPFNAPAQQAQALKQPLHKALGNCHWHNNIEQKLWLKLIINIAINPLTAINQIKNGQLVEQHFQIQINSIIKEAMPLFDKLALDFNHQSLLQTINDVITATSENYSSMNRDIFHKRATENRYINGYLLKKASQFNIETPLIKSLYEQIKVLENHSQVQLSIG